MPDAVSEIRAALEPLASPPTSPPSGYSVTAAPAQVFNDLSLGVARATTAVEAIRHADSAVRFVLGAGDPAPSMFFAAKRIDASRRPLVVFGIGVERYEARKLIAAYHLYPDDASEATALSTDPVAAFGRFGAEYEFEGGERGLFTPTLTYDAARFAMARSVTNEELLAALGLPADGPAYTLVTNLRVLPSGDLLLALPFVLRSDDYVAQARGATGATRLRARRPDDST
jgi:hypothetical protein